jgi:hypothetical protein
MRSPTRTILTGVATAARLPQAAPEWWRGPVEQRLRDDGEYLSGLTAS